jgi:HPr kinase/phosphorylase
MPLTVRQFLEAGQDALSLQIESGKLYLDNVIPEESLNRPGLALAGFFKYFARRRIQVFGLAEHSYLKSLPSEQRTDRLHRLFQKHIPSLVITRNRHAFPELRRLADAFQVPVLRTPLITSHFINAGTIILEDLASPRMRVQGTMVDILGIGVLIEGEPGIGKSETALTLIERGHSLVADDITVVRRDSGGALMASAVEITRYHMEIRGLGIIHVPSLFGVSSIRREMRVDLIVRLHRPDPAIENDRTGLTPQFREVMGVSVPLIALPVAAGRDMAHVVEVAALNQKLKQLGHDAAKELDDRVVKILARQGGRPGGKR